jgi:hypothetical protein
MKDSGIEKDKVEIMALAEWWKGGYDNWNSVKNSIIVPQTTRVINTWLAKVGYYISMAICHFCVE